MRYRIFLFFIVFFIVGRDNSGGYFLPFQKHAEVGVGSNSENLYLCRYKLREITEQFQIESNTDSFALEYN